jgi:uncharacterized membrane protein YesL
VRAFTTAWRAITSFYAELFTLVTVNVFWWVTGGVFVGLALFLAWSGAVNGVLWILWAAPLAAIPAGPAAAALAHVARPAARDLRVVHSFYWEGLRTYWRSALAVSAASMVILTLLLVNFWFYWNTGGMLQIFAILWLYLIILWLGALTYVYPVLVGLREPSLVNVLRTTAVLALANPLYTAVLAVLALALAGVSLALAILLPLALPAVLALLGEHSFLLFTERLEEKTREGNRRS